MEKWTSQYFTCDHCGKQGPWNADKWVSWSNRFGAARSFWEHEFHLCSFSCVDELDHLPIKDREKLARSIVENGKRLLVHNQSVL
ncbi:MAG: hypothetical protein WKF87_06930 [Chryseolinea sp.]